MPRQIASTRIGTIMDTVLHYFDPHSQDQKFFYVFFTKNRFSFIKGLNRWKYNHAFWSRSWSTTFAMTSFDGECQHPEKTTIIFTLAHIDFDVNFSNVWPWKFRSTPTFVVTRIRWRITTSIKKHGTHFYASTHRFRDIDINV